MHRELPASVSTCFIMTAAAVTNSHGPSACHQGMVSDDALQAFSHSSGLRKSPSCTSAIKFEPVLQAELVTLSRSLRSNNPPSTLSPLTFLSSRDYSLQQYRVIHRMLANSIRHPLIPVIMHKPCCSQKLAVGVQVKQAMNVKEVELLGKMEAGMKEKMQQRISAVMGNLDLDRVLHVSFSRCLTPILYCSLYSDPSCLFLGLHCLVAGSGSPPISVFLSFLSNGLKPSYDSFSWSMFLTPSLLAWCPVLVDLSLSPAASA